MTKPGGRANPEDGGDVRMVHVLAILLARWRTIIGLTFGTLAVAAVVVLLLPPAYTARTVVVPAPGESSTRAQLLAGQFGPGVADLMGGRDETTSLIRSVMKSRSLADSVVERTAVAGVSEPVVREILSDHTSVETAPEGAITIEVTAREPELAARIAGEFPELINQIAARLTRDMALRRQEFLEGQLATARDQLILSEQQALEFQLQSDAPEVQEQARQTMEAASELQQAIMQQEVRVSTLSRTATPSNPELRAARAELQAMRSQLQDLVSGAGQAGRIFLSLEESPELKLRAARLLREFAKNEQIYNSLLASLTEAQLDVQNDLPVLSVLDPAVVPRGPSGPEAKVILPLAAILGLVFGVAAAFIGEWARRLRRDPESEPLMLAWDRVRSDLSRYHLWGSNGTGHRRPVERPSLTDHDGATSTEPHRTETR